MKDLKHIQSFNEHQENLNISDVSESFENIDKILKDAIFASMNLLGSLNILNTPLLASENLNLIHAKRD